MVPTDAAAYNRQLNIINWRNNVLKTLLHDLELLQWRKEKVKILALLK